MLRASECLNCIAESYFEGQVPIIYKCALPILHITLGIVQNLFNKMTASLIEEEVQDVEKNLKEIGAVRSPYHGHAFDGRRAHAILSNKENHSTCVSHTSAFNEVKYDARETKLPKK